MILVDSSVWIGYFNGKITPQTDWLDSTLGREIIIVGDLILAEVLQGFKSDRDFNKAKELLAACPNLWGVSKKNSSTVIHNKEKAFEISDIELWRIDKFMKEILGG